MNWFILIIGIILLALGVVLSVKNIGTKVVKSMLCILGVLCIILQASYIIIPTGYTGVRTTFGQIDNVTVQNGFNWKVPFIQTVEKVNNKQQDIKIDDEVWSETSERTAICYKGTTITYQINPEKSAWIYANVSDYENNLVTNALVSSSIKSSSKTLSDTDATNRSIVEPLVMENLQNSLNEKYGENVILINKITINSADFEESYNTAIADKQKAQLEAEKQAINNQKNIDKAVADAEAKVKAAEAEAEVKRIKAEAEAEANEKLDKSLSDKVLEKQKLEKWNGKLPEIVSDSTIIKDFTTNK